ncbi:RDD family protein [Roseibacillus ishigakijimensis]|uniref:RDD family protein n=1 Tax=Roseibacillus ishigakijimensis TaxID=454146 RepID=A0A934RPC6_9BACT|nr:RDD family protein [Roseibacillus ishigakijimensis]MBK1832659.1 RDD family protein [Roseibacillus ishigakijimensis]
METNPYAPPGQESMPEAPLPSGEAPLATLGQRFLASLIDSLIIYLPVLLLALLIDYAPLDQFVWEDRFLPNLLVTATTYLAFILINFHLLSTRAQTLGKAIFKIQVRRLDGRLPSLANQLGIRYFVYWFLAIFPVIGPFFALIDALPIFRKNRRCLHDEIARTQVIQMPRQES